MILFEEGYYDADLNDARRRTLFSPVIELLDMERRGLITASEAEMRIDNFRDNDFRTDLMDRFYRRAVAQQYALNITGGSTNINYEIGRASCRERVCQYV